MPGRISWAACSADMRRAARAGCAMRAVMVFSTCQKGWQRKRGRACRQAATGPKDPFWTRRRAPPRRPSAHASKRHRHPALQARPSDGQLRETRWHRPPPGDDQPMHTHTSKNPCPRAHHQYLPRLLLAAALLAFGLVATAQTAPPEQARWQRQAQAVTITRDDWGIAHVHGKTDADAVFGMVYAQAEDDFNRVETNYLTALGRTRRGRGRSGDLAGPAAEAVHRPGRAEGAVRAEPGLAEGADERLGRRAELLPGDAPGGEAAGDHAFRAVDGAQLHRGQHRRRHRARIARRARRRSTAGRGSDAPAWPTPASWRSEPTGSNGIAIAPKLTADGHALLLINPHTSFFFRSELQMTSDEGLNAYGAVTWGQFFIYQGFNAHVGWMHTSSGVDVVDEFAETIVRKGGKLFYRYGKRAAAGDDATDRRALPRRRTARWPARSFTAYRTHHGPIVRAAGRQVDRRRADEQAGRGAGAVAACAPRPATTPAS